jgi:acetolactate synthase-1/2/3 large subunit
VPSNASIEAAAARLKAAKQPVVLISGSTCSESGLAAAGRLKAAGIRVMIDTFVARQARGAGRFMPDRMLYFGEMALKDLAGSDLMVLVETALPVSFFAYPDMPSVLVPEGCAVETLADKAADGVATLIALADALGAPASGVLTELALPEAPKGELNAYTIGDSIARHMPENAVISDDAVTAGLPIYTQTAKAPAHEWLMLTGGAIGQGIPVAIGAAIACPDRKVLSLNGDGAAMYTVQGLWTMVREDLDVTVVVFANHAYRILNIEFARTGSGKPGPAARALLDLGSPHIDWVELAKSLGMQAVSCDTAEAFDADMATAMSEKGPRMIVAALD